MVSRPALLYSYPVVNVEPLMVLVSVMTCPRSSYDHCVLPLTRFVQSPQSNDDIYRRREAARIASDLASPAYIPAMIELLDDADPDVRVVAARALLRLTGSTRGFDEAYWRAADLEAGRTSWRAWSRANG